MLFFFYTSWIKNNKFLFLLSYVQVEFNKKLSSLFTFVISLLQYYTRCYTLFEWVRIMFQLKLK